MLSLQIGFQHVRLFVIDTVARMVLMHSNDELAVQYLCLLYETAVECDVL